MREHVNWADGNKNFRDIEAQENKESLLNRLYEVFKTKRRTGSTTELLKLIVMQEEATLVTPSLEHYQRIVRMMNENHGTNQKVKLHNLSLQNPEHGSHRFSHGKIFFDHSCANAIIEIAQREIIEAKSLYKNRYRQITEDQISLSQTISTLFPSWTDHKYSLSERGMVTSKGIAETAKAILYAYHNAFQQQYAKLKLSQNVKAIKYGRIKLKP